MLDHSGNLGGSLSRDPTMRDQKPYSPAASTSKTGLTQVLRRDPLLLSACLICGLLIGYQLGMTLVQPPWIKPATNWLRAGLAWPELALTVLISLRFTHTRRPGAASWWMVSLALLSFAIARTWWAVDDLVVHPTGVPFPSLPDYFFVLQYPFFFLAIILLPSIHPWMPRLRVILDDLLWMSTATALSWYFLLDHIFLGSGESVIADIISLGYPVGDLIVFYGLAVATTRPSRTLGDRWALYILSTAFVCLFIADSWAAVLLRSPRHVYLTGGPPDVFWTAVYALVPLAGLVALRLVRYERPHYRTGTVASRRIQWRDVLVSVRALTPFMVTLVASAVIILNAAMTSADRGRLTVPILPIVVGLGLMLLATVRQIVVSLEYEQLRREQETARAHEEALIEANRRVEEFLGIVSHELKTPLTSLIGTNQLMAQRIDAYTRAGVGPDDRARALGMVRELVRRCESSLFRIGRLVNDLVDDARIREGQLEIEFERCDLRTVVADAVEEQRLLAPTRTIRLLACNSDPILVLADPSRLVQVVSNYVSNALKYSRENQPVVVRVHVMGGMGCVTVRDKGVGLPIVELDQIWDRFHRAEGVAVQSGSDVGMGIGLHICKTIIERHGGQVGVKSVPGRGSTFWFTVPLARTPP